MSKKFFLNMRKSTTVSTALAIPKNTLTDYGPAFFAKKLWPADSKILIAFIGKPTSVPKTAISALKQVSGDGKMDPLQTKVTIHP